MPLFMTPFQLALVESIEDANPLSSLGPQVLRCYSRCHRLLRLPLRLSPL